MKVQYRGQNCRVEFGRYANHENVAIVLYCEDGTPMAKASVNPEYKLDKGFVLIKDYSENEGMLETLVNAGIVEDTGETIPCGYADANLCKLLVAIED